MQTKDTILYRESSPDSPHIEFEKKLIRKKAEIVNEILKKGRYGVDLYEWEYLDEHSEKSCERSG